MKKKVILYFLIFTILLLSVAFINSYVQALSKEEKVQIENEILEPEIRKNDSVEEADKVYRNIEERMTNCYDNCKENESCPIYYQHSNCMNENNQCTQKNYNCRRNCNNKQYCIKKSCNR